ncbi:MAG: response regulator [Polyangiaceae bacterium]
MSAENGRAGIDLAAKCGPDAILLDFSMPGMDGAEVLRLLKSDARTSAIPVVMLTAVPELAWGAVGSASSAFLEKPCDPETLVQTMLRVVRPRPGPAEARATRRTNRHG